MTDRIDLHTHTTASDGTYSPEALIDYAAQKDLRALAITDHDTIDAIDQAQTRAELYQDLEVIPGIEYSTNSDICKSDIHILGYYINHKDKTFTGKLEAIIDSRNQRNRKMIKAFQEAGFDLTLEDVLATSDDGVITRAHFAKAMENKGIVPKMSKAFDRYIGDGKPFHIEREKVTQKMAIDMIRACGGVPVLAHPVLYGLNLRKLEALVKDLTAFGLQGIEGIYTTYKTHETKYITDIGSKYGLIVTGGSDFHGAHKPAIDLGCGYGDLTIPYRIRDDLYRQHLTNLSSL